MIFPLLLKEYVIEGKAISLYEPDKEAVAESYRKGEITFPYWSQVWPAAIGLSQFLINNSFYLANKKVLELAAGLGLPSFIAADYAHIVITSDYAPEAVDAMQQTVELNALKNVQVQLLDWNDLPENLCTDILLLSDVSYDAVLFSLQQKIIRQFLAQGTTVIISTPQRLIAKEAIAPLLSFCKHQQEVSILHHNNKVAVTVLVLQQHH